jgi:hypothetical protein
MKLPLDSISNIEPAKLLLLLPIIYLLGMVVDDLAFGPLNKIRKSIQQSVFRNSKNYMDEMIAYHSTELYQAYEARVRRVRILGAAIFNWPMLGLAILINVGSGNLPLSIFVVLATFILLVVSITAWKNLYKRAYEFRRKAIDVIKKYGSLES